MKLHFFTTDNPQRSILMLSDYVPADVDRLCEACRDLASRKISEFALHEQAWITPVDHCQFVWKYSDLDLGVACPPPGSPFFLRYSDEAWLEVGAKLHAVRVNKLNHMSELTVEGDVSVVVSPDGKT